MRLAVPFNRKSRHRPRTRRRLGTGQPERRACRAKVTQFAPRNMRLAERFVAVRFNRTARSGFNSPVG